MKRTIWTHTLTLFLSLSHSPRKKLLQRHSFKALSTLEGIKGEVEELKGGNGGGGEGGWQQWSAIKLDYPEGSTSFELRCFYF